jgi:outer membrane lipoprotein carrier protein
MKIRAAALFQTDIVMKFILTLVTSIALAGSLLLSARAETTGDESALDIARRLQQRYDNIQSLLFTFHQDTQGEMTGRPRKGSGKAAFLKTEGNSRMRWDYQSPDRQVLLSDGVEFFMYFENLQQMIISPAAALDADLTYSFFTGRGKLERDFTIEHGEHNFQARAIDPFKVIKLTPRLPQSQVQDIHLWVTDDSLIRRITLRDHFGTLTTLNLSDINVNGLEGYDRQALDTLFSFVPPEGTEMIYQ